MRMVSQVDELELSCFVMQACAAYALIRMNCGPGQKIAVEQVLNICILGSSSPGMRTLLGPYQQDTPAATKLEAMDKPWVSAVELAEVAIHLAQLKGIKEPDVAGAVALLKHTWQARHALTPLACADMELVHDIYGREVEAASVVRKPDKDFPGSAIIRPPRSYPIPLDVAVRHVSGEYSRKRRTDFRHRMLNSSRAALGLSAVTAEQAAMAEDSDVADEVEFWQLAKCLAPFCPRFARFYKPSQDDATKSIKAAKRNKVRKRS
jgi:hypothetical protein